MKKFCKHILLLFCIFIFVFTGVSFSDEIDTSEYESLTDITTETSSSVNNLSSINSRAYIVLDRKTNNIILGKNEHQKRKMASTTKIMTALVVIENSDLSTLVEASKKAANTGGSRLGLKTGDKITINDLLYGLMLCSGNDAAVCLAEAISGSVTNFADLMNAKAKELNLDNTHFITPHGLDEEEHYTTAYELATLANYALNNKTFSKIVETKSATISINGYPKSLSNTNELLGVLNGVYGVKTGFTNGANRCLVTACKRGEMDIICIVLGADTKKFRTQDSIKLIEYTFTNYEYFDLKDFIDTKFNEWKSENNNLFSVYKGTSTNLNISYTDLKTPIIPIKKDEITFLNVTFSVNYFLEAPIFKEDVIGNMKILNGDTVLYSLNIFSNEDIKKKNIVDYIFEFYKEYPNLLNDLIYK